VPIWDVQRLDQQPGQCSTSPHLQHPSHNMILSAIDGSARAADVLDE